jgi:hypothetical protein
VFEIVVFNPALGVEARADAIVVASSTIIVVIDVHSTKPHPGHSFGAQLVVPAVVDGHMEVTQVVGVSIVITNKIYIPMSVLRDIPKPTPRDCDAVSLVRNVTLPVCTVGEGAMSDKNISPSPHGKAVPIAHTGRICDIDISDNDIPHSWSDEEIPVDGCM